MSLLPRPGGDDVPEEHVQVRGVSHLAFPERQDCPAESFEFCNDSLVSLNVQGELRRPELGASERRSGVSAAWMSMPEAAVYEHNAPVSRKNDVWPPG
ncbi:hypothetical protein D3C87_1135650 [compost metagenome]